MRVMPRQILIWCCCLLLVQLVIALTGDNVCKRMETDSETIEYIVAEPVTYRLYTWCLKMPPRCSKYTTVMKERIKTKLQINNHTIDFCCDGYVQLETYCVPKCNLTECPNMRCDSELKCICEAGYYGQRCHRTCRPGFWGENCANKCVCNGEPCNLQNGDCIHTTSISPITSVFTSSVDVTLSPQNIAPDRSKEFLNVAATTSTINVNQMYSQLPTMSTMSTKNVIKTEKTVLSQDLSQQDTDLDSTAIPPGISLEDLQTTLLPEDEVMIVYPSVKPKTNPFTKLLQLDKITPLPTTVSTRKLTENLQPNLVTKPSYWPAPEKVRRLTTVSHFAKIHELNVKNNKLTDSNMLTTEQTKIIDENRNNKNINKMNANIKKYYGSTVQPIVKHIKYTSESLLPKKSNGLPPPVPDGSDNSLQVKTNNDVKNITSLEENGNNNNHIIIKTNDIQRDMEESNSNNNFSHANVDTTVNSSLVKAKWNSALDAIDFSSPSIIISITVSVILFLALIAVMVTHCKNSKTDQSSSSFYRSNMKACHDNALVCSGHYSTPGGQPVFFCPAFTNTYAFELAQELREAHYDHPRSARCLSNEPVYAELQY